MEKKNLLFKIDEAIASQKTAPHLKELLIEIKSELNQGESFKDYILVVVKLIELMGVFSEFIDK